LAAGAVLPAVAGRSQAGRGIARNGLALLLSLQLAVLCAIIGLSPALPIALLLGVLLGHRDRLPVWLAGGVGTLALLAPLQGGAALWPTLLQAGMLAGLTLFLGQVALRLRQQTEASATARVGLPRSHAISPPVPILARMPIPAPMHRVRWPMPWPTLHATCRPSVGAKPRHMPRTRRSARPSMPRAPR
jgi:hypothetical protein